MASSSTKSRQSRGGKVDLPRNSKGGIRVEKQDLEAAWRFLTRDVQEGQVTESTVVQALDLRAILNTVFPGLTLKEVTYVLGHKESMTFEQLYEAVRDNYLDESIDPVKDAFDQLADNKDYIELSKIQHVFDGIGNTGLSDQVFEAVFHSLCKEEGVDESLKREKKIDLAFFRALCKFGQMEDDPENALAD